MMSFQGVTLKKCVAFPYVPNCCVVFFFVICQNSKPKGPRAKTHQWTLILIMGKSVKYCSGLIKYQRLGNQKTWIYH